jgi:transcriptional regulator with XRE-family HTH domain
VVGPVKSPRASNFDDEPHEKGSRKPNPVDIHVGGRVRFRRMLLGMSQEKLGERLGLTFQQVQKYEKGINRIGASRLYDLSNVLGVPIQFFYDEAPGSHGNADASVASGFGDRQSESYITDFLNTREGLELNKAFVRIQEGRVRRAVVELARSLAGDERVE